MTYPTLGSESAIATVTCTTLFFFITAIVYALRKCCLSRPIACDAVLPCYLGKH